MYKAATIIEHMDELQKRTRRMSDLFITLQMVEEFAYDVNRILDRHTNLLADLKTMREDCQNGAASEEAIGWNKALDMVIERLEFIAENKPMTFREYLMNIRYEDTFDMIVGDEEMPCTVIWLDEFKITDLFVEKYGVLLDAEIVIRTDMKNRYTKCIGLLGDIPAKIGKSFVKDLAGYCDEDYYNKLLGITE